MLEAIRRASSSVSVLPVEASPAVPRRISLLILAQPLVCLGSQAKADPRHGEATGKPRGATPPGASAALGGSAKPPGSTLPGRGGPAIPTYSFWLPGVLELGLAEVEPGGAELCSFAALD
jgi:hypothetical protein